MTAIVAAAFCRGKPHKRGSTRLENVDGGLIFSQYGAGQSRSGDNSEQDRWNGGNTPSLTYDVEQIPFVIGNARGHFSLQLLHWQNLDININDIRHEETQMLHEQMVGYESILAELNLDGNSILHKIWSGCTT